MWKKIRWFGLVVGGLAVLFATAAWVVLTWVMVRPNVYAPTADVGPVELRSWEEHDSIYQSAIFPYVLELEQNSGELLYFGAQHVTDARDPQLMDLERRWNEFRPTIAFCEGRARRNRFESRPTSGPYQESSFIRFLAHRDGIPVYTLEPTYEDEVAGMLGLHEAKWVAAYLFLRSYSSEVSGYQGNRDDLAWKVMKRQTKITGLQRTFDSLQKFDEFWQREFAEAGNWRTVAEPENLPKIREVGHSSRQIRGEHMVRALTELVGRGERVFAAVGASHVIRQEPFLRKRLGK